MSAPRKPVEATVDSVIGAVRVLYDWLGGPDPKTDIVRAEPERDARIPAIVVDTEGEER